MRNTFCRSFSGELSFWFSKDRSCWLLDQLFWLSSSLSASAQPDLRKAWKYLRDKILFEKLSPLFEEAPDGETNWRETWFRDRLRFLKGIEATQRRLVHDGRGLQEPEIEALTLRVSDDN